MSEISMPVGLLDTLIPLVVGIIVTLIGILYRRLIGRVDDIEDDVDELSEEHTRIHQKVDTVFSWAFGNDEDATDRGLSGDIDHNFSELTAQLEDLEDRLDERHSEIRDRVRDLINVLHDEESLEFEREDMN
ncbi:hypothetical protein OB919_19990 [Halobacteria archaeon AArc-curdl1]|uniref:Uncharacterized protein n=1 Tax=Natronosalvus hydrolyticus TaxID=2979988 RepID=A0AAP2ZBK9_9EURY|nr:hypothetical protein [Halobacteria archaeon AArc-curdl1]